MMRMDSRLFSMGCDTASRWLTSCVAASSVRPDGVGVADTCSLLLEISGVSERRGRKPGGKSCVLGFFRLGSPSCTNWHKGQDKSDTSQGRRVGRTHLAGFVAPLVIHDAQ